METINNRENREKLPLLFCLKKIIDIYSGEISYKTILNLIPNVKQIFDTEMFIATAENLGLSAIEKEVKIENIPEHLIPCIVFNEENNPIIILEKTKNKIKIYDPIENEEKEIEEIKNTVKTILIFKDTYTKNMYEEVDKESWFWNPIKTFWKKYIEILIITIFINIFALTAPLFSLSVYDRVIPNAAFDTLFVFVVGIIIIIGLDIYFKNVRNHIIEQISEKLNLYFEENLMKRMLLLKSHGDDMQIGVKANLFKELHFVKEFFATKTITQIIDLPFFIIGTVVIFLISPILSLIPILLALFVIFFNFIMQKQLTNLTKQNANCSNLRNGFMIDTIRGTELIKLHSAVPTKLFHWKNILAIGNSIGKKMNTLNSLSLNISQSIVQILTVLMIIVGVFEINEHNLSVGGLIACTLLGSRAIVPVIQSSLVFMKIKEIKESLNHISKFWAMPIENLHNEIGVKELKGNIEFKDISYVYKGEKNSSLENFNLKINEGEKIGIIGRTGSGKSTILKLLTNLISPDKGNIYIDNYDISTLHPTELRQNIGIMMQEPYIFAGTLKENIELTAPISKDKMMELINITGLTSLVKKSGQGEGMQISEGGSNLSIGQKHLIGLARSLANDPNILILDEPTTGLDIGLEDMLVKNLKQITKEKTLLVITHRFKALELVDRVIIIQDGKIIADGKKEVILTALSEKRI